MTKHYKKGFTLVELLAVIAIIGVLTGIIIPNLTGARQSSRDAKRVADLKSIQLALGLFYHDNLKFPQSLSNLVPAYLPALPLDPSSGTNYAYTPLVQTASPIVTCNASTIIAYYHLGAVMETTSYNNDDVDRVVNSSGQSTINSLTYTPCNGSTPFHGQSNTCNTVSSQADQCYDIEPQ